MKRIVHAASVTVLLFVLSAAVTGCKQTQTEVWDDRESAPYEEPDLLTHDTAYTAIEPKPDPPAVRTMPADTTAADTEMLPEADTLSAESLDWYRFLRSYKYPPLQDVVFAFFKAYIRGDIEAAERLIDTPDRPCMAYFPDTKGSLDAVDGYFSELIRHTVSEHGTETAVLHVRYRLHGSDMAVYMTIDAAYLDTVDDDGFTFKTWKVTNFDFDA